MSKLLVQVQCAAIADDDVKNIELTSVVTPPGQPAVTSVTTLAVADVTKPPSFQLTVDRDTVMVFTEVAIDGSGNRSPASDPTTFTAADTFPPGKPGAMSATVIGQVPDPAPSPPPVPTP